jgi:hypothetical protein
VAARHGYPALRDTFVGSGASAAAQIWLDVFHRIVIEGRGVGVHSVLSADRVGAVAPALTSTIAQRLVLQQVDERAWADAGVPTALARTLEALPPGRGLLDGRLLAQVAGLTAPAGSATEPGVKPAEQPAALPDALAGAAVPGQEHQLSEAVPQPRRHQGEEGASITYEQAAAEDDETPATPEQAAAAVDGRAQTSALQALGSRAPGYIPNELATRALEERESLPPREEDNSPSLPDPLPAVSAVLGIADVTRTPVVVQLQGDGLVITGPRTSGRSTALIAVAESLRTSGCELYAIGTARSPLRHLVLPEGHSAFATEQITPLVNRLFGHAESRPSTPRVLLIDDASRLLGDEAATVFNQLAETNGVQVVAALDANDLSGGYAYTRLMDRIRAERQRLVLQPDELMLHSVLGVRFALRPGLVMPRGRGVLYTGGTPLVVHVGQVKQATTAPISPEAPSSTLEGAGRD